MTDRKRLLAMADRVLRLEAESIALLRERLDDRFVRAVELMHRCRGRVIVTGMGKSGLIGRKIAATLASTGTPAYFLHPARWAISICASASSQVAFTSAGESPSCNGPNATSSKTVALKSWMSGSWRRRAS